MPILWEGIDLIRNQEWPKGILEYPATGSKRALSYVRYLSIGVYDYPWFDEGELFPSEEDFYELSHYLFTSLQMLRHVGSIHSIRLEFVGVYEPNDFPSECTNVIETFNRTMFDILRHVAKMQIPKVDFCPGRLTARLEDITSIIERKVDMLHISSPLNDWARLLQRFERLKVLDMVRLLPISLPRSLQVDSTLWMAVSQMPNLSDVRAVRFPLPPRLDISFPHLVHLEMDFTGRLNQIEIGEVSNTLLAIFKLMPALESLKIINSGDEETRRVLDDMQIKSLACQNLRELHLVGPIPNGLVSTTARHCSHLIKFYTHETSNFHNEDLLQLSVSCPTLREIGIQDPIDSATGVEYFTAFHKLERLELHYTAGKYLDIMVLLKFATSCPRLNQIHLSDWDTTWSRSQSPKPFAETAVEILFPVAAHTPSYFVPRISRNMCFRSDGFDGYEYHLRLDEYALRIDKVRKDAFEFQQLAERLGTRGDAFEFQQLAGRLGIKMVTLLFGMG